MSEVVRYAFSIDIPAPRDFVWAIAQDAGMRPRWDVRVARYTVHGDQEAGARVTIVFRALGRPVAEAAFVRFEPPRQSVVKVGPASPAVVPTGGGTWIFEETPSGTRMTTRFSLRQTGALRAPWWLIGFFVRRDTTRSLENLRALVMEEWRKRAG